MKLPKKKVKKLIGMMNSLTQVKIPPMKPILEIFDMAMDEKTLDYLLRVGTEEHTLRDLKKLYIRMYGRADYDANWEAFWNEIYEMSFLIPGEEDSEKFLLATIFPGWIELSVSGPLNNKRAAIIEKFMTFWDLLRKVNIAPIRMLTDLQGMRELKTNEPHMSTFLSTGKKAVPLNEPLTSEHQVRATGATQCAFDVRKMVPDERPVFAKTRKRA